MTTLGTTNGQADVFYRAVLDSMSSSVFVIDVESYEVVFSNRPVKTAISSGERPCCYALSHQREEPCNGTLHPCPLTEVKRSGQAVVVEHVHVEAGREHVVEIHASPLFDDAGRVSHIVEHCLDITERKSADVQRARERLHLERQVLERDDRLRQLEDFSATILNAMADGVTLISPDGTFEFVNPAAAALVGARPTELVGTDSLAIVAQEQLPTAYAADERRRVGVSDSYEIDLIHRDGSRVSVLVSGSPHRVDGHFAGTLCVITNLSKVRGMERALTRRLRELKALAVHSRRMTSSMAQDEVVDAALDGVEEVLAPDLCHVCMVENGDYRILGLRHPGSEGAATDDVVREVARCICEAGEAAGRALFVNDLEDMVDCDHRLCTAFGIRSVAVIPLTAAGKVLGYLGVGSNSCYDFRDNSAFLEALSSQVGIALNNAISYETLKATLDALPDLMFEVDTHGRIRDFRVHETRKLALPPEQFLGNKVSEILPPEAARAIMSGLADAAVNGRHEGTVYSLEIDGEQRWYEMSIAARGELRGEHAILIALCRDVTQRKRAEGARRLLSEAIEQSNDAVMITDPDGNILYVNRAFELMTGYARDQVLGKTPRVLNSGRHDERFYAEMWAKLRRGETWQGNLVNRRADGTVYEEGMVISPTKGEHGEVVNFVALKRDVSEEMEFLRRSQQARKMEAIGRFAAGIAHDFKNSLMVIQGCSDLMLRELDDVDTMRQHLEIIRRATDGAARFTRSLLAFSRQQLVDMDTVDLPAFIADLIPMLRRCLPTNVLLEFVPAAGDVLVRCDKAEIERVLFNLCSNAADAMSAGGSITIHTGVADIDQAYVNTHPWAVAGPYAYFSVSDTGIGMDAATLGMVLDPFFTTKEPGKGTGLGLSSSYSALKRHGGMIEISSVVGEGTSCIAFLPKAQGDSVGAKVEEPEAQEVVGGSETILVVDDRPDLRLVIAGLLESLGYRPLVAASAEEAVRCLEQRGDEVALVISDLVMPGMSGEELCQRGRELRPGLPFLFCSGNKRAWWEMSPDIRRGSLFVEKPFDIDHLALKVRETIERKDDREVH